MTTASGCNWSMASPRLVILASGNGTNAQALLDACASGELEAHVVSVITNNDQAGVVARAQAAGVHHQIVEHRGRTPEQRAQDDRGLIEVIRSSAPDLVVLAGWMRILGSDVGAAFPIINLHPAKPGEFAGVKAIERAFDAWTRGEIVESGVMVHWVPDEGVDIGPVIAAAAVPFQEGDTVSSFAERVHKTEHQLIVRATRLALEQDYPSTNC